jgi:site-specific recombinase XerD
MTLNKALGIEEEVSEGEPPLLTDLLEEFIRIKSKDRAQNTIRNYRSNTKVLREFMDYSLLEESSKLNPQDKLKLSAWYTKNFGKTKSRLYKFNETDLNFYHLLREWNSLKGNNDNYFYKIISFVKAVLRYFHSIEPNKYKPHNHIEHPDFKAEKLSVPHSVLNEAEIQRLFDYKGLEKYENVSSLAKILYYGCFRWDELEQELKKKDKGSLELVRRNVEGKEVEYWNIYLGKQKIHKTIPVNKTLKSVLFDEDYHFISDQKFRDYLKELLSLLSIEKEYSIGSHSFRRSFITNMINRGYSVVHIMEYSGHQTEAQFREYCRRENIEIKTLNPIHID